MCGIAGWLGQSIHPKASYALMTSLLLKTEIRGKEATGFWGAQAGEKGDVIYHKEPIAAQEFVRSDMWKALRKFNPNILLAHCREPTPNGGLPKVNKNNHPHVNHACNVALIHNGKVEEYGSLKSEYGKVLQSNCDSELILRMFERGELFKNKTEEIKTRYNEVEDVEPYLVGVEHIFSKLTAGAMAVAVGVRHPGKRRSLWLFRDDKRPLHLIDLRKSLNQIFFCSTLQIWREAVDACTEAKAHVPSDHEVIEFPSLYTYCIDVDFTEKDSWRELIYHVIKDRITVDKDYKEEDLLSQELPVTVSEFSVITVLDEDDNVIRQKPATEVRSVSMAALESKDGEPDVGGHVTVTEINKQMVGPPVTPEKKTVHHEQPNFDLKKMSELVDRLRGWLEDVGTAAHNLAMEGSIKPEDFQAVLDDLEQIEGQLQSTMTANLKMDT